MATPQVIASLLSVSPSHCLTVFLCICAKYEKFVFEMNAAESFAEVGAVIIVVTNKKGEISEKLLLLLQKMFTKNRKVKDAART